MKVYFPLLNGPHWQGTTCFQLLNVSHLRGTCRVAAMPMEMALSPENKGSPGPACAGGCSWSPLCSGSNRDCAGNVVPCLGTWLCPLQSASACSFYTPGRHAAACSFFLVSVPRFWNVLWLLFPRRGGKAVSIVLPLEFWARGAPFLLSTLSTISWRFLLV